MSPLEWREDPGLTMVANEKIEIIVAADAGIVGHTANARTAGAPPPAPHAPGSTGRTSRSGGTDRTGSTGRNASSGAGGTGGSGKPTYKGGPAKPWFHPGTQPQA